MSRTATPVVVAPSLSVQYAPVKVIVKSKTFFPLLRGVMEPDAIHPDDCKGEDTAPAVLM